MEAEEAANSARIAEAIENKKKTINSRLYAYSKANPCAFFMGMLSAAIQGMNLPIFALLFAEAIYRLNFFGTSFAPEGNYDSFKLRCFEMIIVGAVAGLFQFFMMYFFSVIGQSLTRKIR